MYLDRVEQIITRSLYNTTAGGRSKSGNSVPILAYHEICDLPRNIRHLHSYNVTPSAFSDQMEFLYSNHYFVMRLEDLIFCLSEKKEIPNKVVIITFDDGYKNYYTNADPVLKKYRFPATIFLPTDYIGRDDVFPWFDGLCSHNGQARENWVPLSWEEVEELSRGGITFGSHTCSHANIRQMSNGDFEKEIQKSKEIIEEKINRPVDLFSYPFSFPKYRRRHRGLIQETRKALYRAGFAGACTTIIGTNSPGSDLFCLKRIQIKNTDDLFTFQAKLKGAYNWVGLAQKWYQRIIEPLIEGRR